LTLDGNLMAAEVKNGASLQAGVPRLLFETPARIVPINTEYCATGDGKKFLFRESVIVQKPDLLEFKDRSSDQTTYMMT
jgi:hypothetical protein